MTINSRSKLYARPSGFEQITVGASAIGLTAASIGKAAFITIENADIRYRIDGTNPTATVGHLVGNGGSIYLAEVKSLANFKMIRTGDTSATAFVTHY